MNYYSNHMESKLSYVARQIRLAEDVLMLCIYSALKHSHITLCVNIAIYCKHLLYNRCHGFSFLLYPQIYNSVYSAGCQGNEIIIKIPLELIKYKS